MAEQMLDFWPNITEAKPKVTPLSLMRHWRRFSESTRAAYWRGR
jgi:hypothetical protein